MNIMNTPWADVEVGMFECSLDPELSLHVLRRSSCWLPCYAVLSFEATYSEWDNSILEARLLGRSTTMDSRCVTFQINIAPLPILKCLLLH